MRPWTMRVGVVDGVVAGQVAGGRHQVGELAVSVFVLARFAAAGAEVAVVEGDPRSVARRVVHALCDSGRYRCTKTGARVLALELPTVSDERRLQHPATRSSPTLRVPRPLRLHSTDSEHGVRSSFHAVSTLRRAPIAKGSFGPICRKLRGAQSTQPRATLTLVS
jgi:hypothetical protein